MSADLTGCWYGHYAGTGDVEANRFIALLDEAGGRIAGSISEPDDLGLAAVRHAVVSGRRTGAAVTFVKQYDGQVLAHAVAYEGTLDDAATRLAGSWSFADYSGSFVMEREIFAHDERADEAEAPLALEEGR